MKQSRLIARLLAPLAIALFLAGMYLGLSRPTLVETPMGAVHCASAFGTGTVQGATETGQASCAALTSERQVWSATLVAISVGLLLGLVWVTASSVSTQDEQDGGHGPGGAAAGGWRPLDPSAGWADYPGQSPTTRAPRPQPEPPSPGGPQDPPAPGASPA